MRGNSFGKFFSVTTFGESHGRVMGVVIDGMPSKIQINLADLQKRLDKRAPGRNEIQSARQEDQSFEILSGVFEGQTLGTPISVIIYNRDQRSEDYDQLKNTYRPGHADQTTQNKYGIRDHRGGGRSSGRETVSRVIAGYFASLLLPKTSFESSMTKIAHFHDENGLDTSKGELCDFLLNCKKKGESCGGEIKLTIKNPPSSLGEPCFDKLRSDLAKAITSIGSCMGISFGAGPDFITKLGTEVSQNAVFFGGMEGGISNGDDIILRAIFKAPSTIGEKAKKGRHDPCILPRVQVVVESMAMITLADHLLRQKTIQLD
jgi:chorismate synthase